jgi:hypothetical protein
VLWRDGELTDIRLPGGQLGTRRFLPAADAGAWCSYDLTDGVGGRLAVRTANDGTSELLVRPKNGKEQALRRVP